MAGQVGEIGGGLPEGLDKSTNGGGTAKGGNRLPAAWGQCRAGKGLGSGDLMAGAAGQDAV